MSKTPETSNETRGRFGFLENDEIVINRNGP